MDGATELGIVMRASRILVVLALLIAPPSAHGQQTQQDVAPPLDAAFTGSWVSCLRGSPD
jgi:hypothetical protein